MKIPARIISWLFDCVRQHVGGRSPDFIIGTLDDPYLHRWFLIPRNKLFNIYLHKFMRSDDDRALHDHPWWNLSILLKGDYVEHTINAGGINVRSHRSAGGMKFRTARTAHRVELPMQADGYSSHELACWTLFVTGPRIRDWGFHCPQGWKRWQDFTNPNNSGEIGPGCDDGTVITRSISEQAGSLNSNFNLTNTKTPRISR